MFTLLLSFCIKCDIYFANEQIVGRKTNWPELLGMKAEDAEKKIKEEMPRATVHVIPHDSFVTMDFVSNRVRLFVDSSQNVIKAPKIG
ncbi:hypothetical protein L1987_04425 [Smallanthus sonchifolius]|uniref:Uncharacterized protein n=1 Tax=Smallanthus sonchifolius TaxID=185202 RepID=A0ACB9KDE7_9ASTR|nr:hypothetical protein L1987_04425 [Smallanthus sonchifolius]